MRNFLSCIVSSVARGEQELAAYRLLVCYELTRSEHNALIVIGMAFAAVNCGDYIWMRLSTLIGSCSLEPRCEVTRDDISFILFCKSELPLGELEFLAYCSVSVFYIYLYWPGSGFSFHWLLIEKWFFKSKMLLFAAPTYWLALAGLQVAPLGISILKMMIISNKLLFY